MELNQYGQIKTKVWSLLHIDLNAYKSEQMYRRLDSWLVRSASPNWDDYFKRVQADPKELSKFRDYLTINVSEFFRDIERWKTLKEQIIPGLLDAQRQKTTPQVPGASRAGLRIWSAGCSTGQEPYSLAMLMDEVSPTGDHMILATDLDRGALQKATARGPYSADDIRNVSPERLSKYFENAKPPAYVKERITQKVKFRELNLLLDNFESNLDLIVCRNVIIYFTSEAKAALYKHFCAALRSGGILFLGGTEIIPHPIDFGLRSQGISFYVKV